MFNAESARVAARVMSERTTREHAGRKAAVKPQPRRLRQLVGRGVQVLSHALRRRHARRRIRSV